jgi:hypothetical protein
VTEPGFSQRQVSALAALVHECRPSWNEAGIAAEVRRHAHLPLLTVARAMLRAAADPNNETPGVLSSETGPVWTGADVNRCARHPEQWARRTDGECASCFADRCGVAGAPMRDRGGKPIPAETRAAMRAALSKAGL